jgi:hypothetical protein
MTWLSEHHAGALYRIFVSSYVSMQATTVFRHDMCDTLLQ